MSKELTTQQKVVLLKGDIQLWMDADRADELANNMAALNFDDDINFDGRNFIKAIYQGVFLPQDITEQTNRKNGQWKCKGLQWHDRGERCQCATQEEKTRQNARMEAIQACGKCTNGFIVGQHGARQCECIKNLTK